jgi:hypothetical protein
VDLHRPRAAADDVTPFHPIRVLLLKLQEMPGILRRGTLGPLHLDGDQGTIPLDDEIHNPDKNKVDFIFVA